MNISRDMEKNLYTLSKEQWEIEKERLFQRTLRHYNEKIEKDDELKKLIQQKYNTKKPAPPVSGLFFNIFFT